MRKMATFNIFLPSLFLFFSLLTLPAYAQQKTSGPSISPPTGVHAFPGDGKIYLQWNPVNDPGLDHYEIVHGDESYVGTTTDTFYTETSLTNGTSYTYAIMSVDTSGNYSNWSTEVPSVPKSRIDNFGYTWKSNRDLDDNVPFSWTDISATGTPIPMSGAYENTGFYSLGFDFPFYNFQFDSFRVCTNGYISFTSNQVISYNNYQMPATEIDGPVKNLASEQGNIIAPFLTELNFPDTYNAFYENFGSYTIIQYNHVSIYAGDKVASDNTFQIILHDDGSFDFAYLAMDPPPDNLQIGWQNYAMDDGLVATYTYSGAGQLSDGIKFDSLLIHAEHDFSATPATVQNIFFTEENGAGNVDNMYKLPIHGAMGKILQYSLNNPLDLAVDMTNKKVYWMYSNSNYYVLRSDLDGQNAEIIATLDPDSYGEPISMDIDPYIGKVYWSDWNGDIYRMNLDGTLPEVVLPPGSIVETANSIALDPDHQMIYWADAGVDSIYRCTYSGSGIEGIYQGYGIYDLKLDPGNNRLFVAENPEGSGFTVMELDGNNPNTFYLSSYNCNTIALDPFNNTLYFARNDYPAKTFTEDKGILALDITSLSSPTETTVIKNLSNDLRNLSLDLPVAPIHLSVQTNVASNILKWPSSPDPFVTEYRIYRDNVGYPATFLATVPAAVMDTILYEDFDISIDNWYFYRVTAVSGEGVSSPYSVQDSVFSIGPPLIAQPQNFSGFPGDNKAYLKWSAVADSNLLGYWIYGENMDTGTNFTDSLLNGDTTYVDNGALNNNHYSYTLTAKNIYGVESIPQRGEEVYIQPRGRLDDFGYTWSSNRDLDDPDPPVFHWTDIKFIPTKSDPTPIPMTGNDENTGLYPIGFEFPFYNFKFDSFRISTNGIISFTSADPEASLSAEFPSGPLGGGMPPLLNKNGNLEVGNILAPYWIDMDFGGEIKAYYQNMGDHIIIQFDHVLPAFSGGKLKSNKTMAADNTFQVILYDDGSFEFVYQNVSWPMQGDLLVGWQDYSAYRGMTVTAAQEYGDYPPDIIDYENLIIRGEYDFTSVDQNVPKLLMTEIGQTVLTMMMSKEGKTSEAPTMGSNIYKIPVSGISGEIVNPWMMLPTTISSDFINDYIYFYDDANTGVMRLNSDGTGLQQIISEYGSISSIRYNPFENLLYFCNGNSIYTANIDGTAVDTLISNSFANVLALDNENNKIYWININNNSLYRANLDGNGTDSLTAISSSDMYDLEVNPGDNSLYWISQMGFVKDGSPNNIFKSDLDGNNIEIILSSDDPIYSIALDPFNNKLYYSTFVMDMMVLRKTDDPDKMSGGEMPGVNMLDLNSMSVESIVPNLDMILDMDLQVPKAPIHVSVDAELAYNNIKWPANPEATVSQYNIYRDTNPYPTTLLQSVFPTKNKVGPDTLSFEDWNVVHDQKYYYRVVALDADGYSSAYSVQDSAVGIGPPDIDLNKETFVYGATPKNTTLYDTLKVYNRGDTDLEIFTVDYVHGNEFWFSGFADLPETVFPGDSMLFYLQFTPGIGDFTDSLIIESDDHIPETDSLKIVSLSGSGFNQSPVVSQVYPDLQFAEDFASVHRDTLNHFFTDPDGDPLTFTITVKSGGIVSISENDTVINVQNIGDMFGEDSVFITADDGFGGTEKQGAKITVIPVNDAPILTGLPDLEFPEEGSAQLHLNNYLTDVDDDTSEIMFDAAVINKEALPKVGEELIIDIDSLTHVATFSGGDDSVGVYTVAVTAMDDSGAVAYDTLKVTVTEVNDAPVLLSNIADQDFSEDMVDMFTAYLPNYFFDVDDTVLTYNSTYQNELLIPFIRNDSLWLSAKADSSGSEMVVITALDKYNETVSDTFLVTIIPVNDPPVLADLPFLSFPEEGSVEVKMNLYVTDIDNDSSALDFSARVVDKTALQKIGEELLIEIDSTLNIITFSGGQDSVGVYHVEITVADDSGAGDIDTMLVEVTEENDPPVRLSEIADLSISEDTMLVFAAWLPEYFNDVDDNELSYQVDLIGTSAEYNLSGDSLFISTRRDKNGIDTVYVTVSDPHSASAADTFLITILPVNDAPVLSSIADISFPEEGSYTLSLNSYVSDVDNDTSELNFSAEVIQKTTKTGEELGISIDSLLNRITFTGAKDSTGTYTVEIVVTDLQMASDRDTIEVTVEDVNDAPLVVNPIEDVTIDEDHPPVKQVADLNSAFKDVEDQQLTFSAIIDTGLTVWVDSVNALWIKPDTNYFGFSQVKVIASDPNEASVTDTFRVTVRAVNDSPLPFILYTPADRDTMDLETFGQAHFTWQAAQDIDNKNLVYQLRIANETFDSTFAEISDTVMTLNLQEFLEYNAIYAWSVFVSDGEFFVASSDTFGFLTPYPDAIGDDINGIPTAYKLHDNYPNPFNPTTTIRFDLPKAEQVDLKVYNIAGQIVRNLLLNTQYHAGVHRVVWDGRDEYGRMVGSGIYIYLIHAGNFREVKKMTLVK